MKRILYACFIMLYGLSSLAQEITQPFKEVIPPSPTVSGLMRFEEVPVNLYTGAPSIAIPLFSKQLNSQMGMGLQLSYNTSGIRVDERSGWTGTGWTLIAGGSISRTIKDLPDEINNTGNKVGTFHNGYEDWDGMSPTQKDEFLWKANAGQEKYDTQVDVFQFNFMGKTGRFNIVRDSSNVLKARLISRNERIKIEFTADVDGIISDFTLTDAMGYQYVFGTGSAFEITSSESASTTVSQWGTVSNSGNINVTPTVSRSAWHLTEVRTPNNELLCTLTYQNVEESFQTPMNRTINSPLTSLSGADFSSPDVGGYNKGQLMPKSVASNASLTIQTKKLYEIEFRDGVKIRLSRTAGHPELGGGSQLSKVELLDAGGSALQYYDLTYTTSTENRLFLTGLSHVADSESQDYVLHYYNLNELPDFNSPEQDQWGYYNHLNNTNSSQPHLFETANVNKVTTGVLTKIDYPTGGSKEFDYESNTFSFIGDQPVAPQTIPENLSPLNQSGTFTATAGSTANEVNQVFVVNIDHEAGLTQSTLTYGADVDLSKHTIWLDAVKLKAGVVYDENNPTIITLNDVEDDVSRSDIDIDLSILDSNTTTVNLTTGWYVLKIRSLSYVPVGSATSLSVYLSLGYRKYTHVQDYMNGAGIRIKEIRFTEDGSTEVKTNYSYNIPDSTNYSSGSFDGLILNQKRYTLTRRHLLFSIGYIAYSIDYEVDEDRNSLYATADKNHFIGYRNVRKEQTGNGYTDYEISSPREFPSFNPGYGYPFDEVEDQSFKTGLTKTESVYNQSNQLLLQKQNSYAYISEDVTRSIWMFQSQTENCEFDRLYDNYGAYLADTPEKGLFSRTIILNQGTAGEEEVEVDVAISTVANCVPASGYLGGTAQWSKGTRADLVETTTTEYFPDQVGATPKTSRQTFGYNATNYQMSQKSNFIFEAGTEYEYLTYLYYPDNYPTAYYTAAEQANINSMLSTDHKYNELIATKTVKRLAGGILPTEALGIVVNKYELNNGAYRLKTYQVAQTPASTATLEDRVEVVSYDILGNPLEVKPTGGPPTAYAWGYDHTKPVIQAQGISSADLQTAISWAITNAGVFPQSVNTLEEVIDRVGDLSQASQQSEWDAFNTKLREHVAVGDNPVVSMIYHRVYGMLSQTDPNGKRSTFEYDAFGRLRLVRDFEGNILSKNEYNLKGPVGQ